MSSPTKLAAGAACFLGAALIVATFALFRGHFDRALFEIKETDWSPAGRVAILAERSDRQALRSDQYFVLIADHVFSASELRTAFYQRREVFNASSDCVTIRWSDAHDLVVSCPNSSLDGAHINLERTESDGVKIIYMNIPKISSAKN